MKQERVDSLVGNIGYILDKLKQKADLEIAIANLSL